MKSFGRTHTGLSRKKNEDRYLIKKISGGSVLLAVADGMGGEVAGEYAAGMTINKMAAIRQNPIENERQLSQLVQEADRAIIDEVKKNSALEGMGCTITCALLRDGVIHWVHVGDSRLVVIRNQEVIQITKDQNMAQFLLEEGEITAEEARLHPSQNQLDQCVGCGDSKPDMGRLEIKAGNLLMLTTDGLHLQVPSETISSILTAPDDIETKAGLLIKAALDAGGKDNMTVLITEI